MITIRVPHAGELCGDEYHLFQKEWKDKVEQALGIEMTYSPYQGREYARYKGAMYSRNGGEFFTMQDNSAENQEKIPHVLCSCGSVVFTLWYGSYEIRGRCVACGSEETVYDG